MQLGGRIVRIKGPPCDDFRATRRRRAQPGTGIGECTVQVHSPRYDFNGDALAIVVVLDDAGGGATARRTVPELTSY